MQIPSLATWSTSPPPRRDLTAGDGMQIVDRVEKDPQTRAARQQADQAAAVHAAMPSQIRRETARSHSNWSIPVLAAPLFAGVGLLAVPVPAVQVAGLALGILGPPVALLLYVTLRRKQGEKEMVDSAARLQQANANLDVTRQQVVERVYDDAVKAPTPTPGEAPTVETGERTVKIGGIVVPRKEG